MSTSAMSNYIHISLFYLKDSLMGVDCIASKILLLKLQAIARLGHANYRVIHNVFQLYKIQCKSKDLIEFCNLCCLGKSHRLHAYLSNINYTSAFYVVHTDL